MLTFFLADYIELNKHLLSNGSTTLELRLLFCQNMEEECSIPGLKTPKERQFICKCSPHQHVFFKSEVGSGDAKQLKEGSGLVLGILVKQTCVG